VSPTNRSPLREGIEQIDLLLREENVTHHGTFHAFENVTSLPRPTQTPRPKFYVAATFTRESFEYAGAWLFDHGDPDGGGKLRETLFAIATRIARPVIRERQVISRCTCSSTKTRARARIAAADRRLLPLALEAANDWTTGTSSSDYKDYDKKYERLSQQTMESLIASGSALIGTPASARVADRLNERIGGFEHASLQ